MVLKKNIKKSCKCNNKECKTCKRPVNYPYVVYNDSKVHCLKCYHNSGASLPMFRK